MQLFHIALIVVALLVLYILYVYFTQTKPLTSTHPANSAITINENKLDNANNATNCTYSIWFYVSNWNYRYGEDKVIFQREGNNGTNAMRAYLDALQNNLKIDVLTYPMSDVTGGNGADGADSTASLTGNTPSSSTFTCGIDNVPLQRWVNLLISVYGRSMDIYLDGKLVRTCVLPGIANISSSKDVVVTPDRGFEGFTSKFMYFNSPSNPQQAWNIYKEGFGGSMLGSLLNRYRIKISFLNNNKESGSYEF